MLDTRACRKRKDKLQKLVARLDSSYAIMGYYAAELKAIEEGTTELSLELEPPQSEWYQPSLPVPPLWNQEQEATNNFTLALANSITGQNLKQLVIDGAIDTAIADY